MKTDFDPDYLQTPEGARANQILRACVHCGFCNATCPTYQVTGDELDGPRGRIYLIRDLLQAEGSDDRVRQHLDRCLTCRACETTCPSGVAYGELAEIARFQLGEERAGLNGYLRGLLRWMIPKTDRLRYMALLGRWFRWMVPGYLRHAIPNRIGPAPNVRKHNATQDQARKILLLNGCAQQVSTPQTNQHLVQLLNERGIGVLYAANEQCCGSLDLHLGAKSAALSRIRDNVDALYEMLDDVEAVVSTASGCGVTIKDYARLLEHDADYVDKACAVGNKTMDVAEYLVAAFGTDAKFERADVAEKVAFHAPCTLQHGQRINTVVESLLCAAGYELVDVADSHLCCGSAGTYSILEPDMADTLKTRKLDALQRHQPDVIATANVGCQSHLATGATVAVKHWIELLG